jgi:hypothetical protein
MQTKKTVAKINKYVAKTFRGILPKRKFQVSCGKGKFNL